MPTQDSGQIGPAPGLFRALGEGSVVAGRYEIERLVARGGMATVFLARQLGLGRKVALKLVHQVEQDAEDRGAFVERFRLEAKTLASLSHPHIVTVYDYGETEDGDCFIAMEYVDGPRFARLLKEGPLPTQRAIDLVIQVCRALRYAHSKGVIHRDVKLSNVLIGQDEHGDEHVQVVDFGLVKITGNDQKLTSHGLVLGSPHFMAPEQVRGGDIDHRADLYSVGILLYCSLTGRYPFHGASLTATMTAHISREVPPFSDLVPDRRFPQGLEAVVLKTLCKDPEHRQPDMEALISELMPFASSPGELVSMAMSSSATLVRHAPGLAREDGPSPLKLVAVAMLSFLLALGAVVALWQSQVASDLPRGDVQIALPRALPAPPAVPVETKVSVETPNADPARAAPIPEPAARPARRNSRSTSAAKRSEPAPDRTASRPAPEPEPTTEQSPAELDAASPEPAEATAAPTTDLSDPWEAGSAEPAEDATPAEESPETWEQAGGDLRNPWGD